MFLRSWGDCWMSKTVYLENVCDILDSQRVPVTAKDRNKGIYPYYGANGVQDYVDDYIFDDELVLLAEDGGNFGSTDKPIAYRVSGKCWVNNHAHVLKAKECIDVDYLCYSLMFYDVSSIVNGATRQKLNQAVMRKMIIPLPDINEQHKIVSKLDKVTHTIDICNSILEKLDLLVKSQFVEMFGDPILNTKGWKMVTIGDIVTEVKYGTSNPAVDGGKYAYLRMNNLTYDGHLDLSDLKRIDIPENEIEKCIVRKGDVLFNRTNSIELVGKTCVFDLDEDMVIAGYIIRVRLNPNMLPLVLSSFMNTDALKKKLRDMAKGAVNQANINAQELQAINVYLPPLDLQTQFADFVQQIDKSKLAVKKTLEKAETLKKALMQEYFG